MNERTAALLRAAKGFLFDMDGVWFVGNRAVTGAAEALAALRAKGLPCRFVTNTTTRTAADNAAKMDALGLGIDEGEVITSTLAAVIYLQRVGAPRCMLVVHDNVRAAFAPFPQTDVDPEVVVIGDIGTGWTYDVMNRAFRAVMGGAKLVAMHKGRYWQVEDGLRIDIGAFVAGLEYATGTEAVLIGKPAPTMFESALADMDLSAEQAVMIGDDIHSDIGGAQNAGMKGVLVKTGKYRDELVRSAGVTPDGVIDSVAALAGVL